MSGGDRLWLRIVGGSCFVNAALTALLVGLASSAVLFSVDSILLPFLAGATVSFAVSLYLVRAAGSDMSPMRKVVLAGVGVVLGSMVAVLGIALLLMLPGG